MKQPFRIRNHKKSLLALFIIGLATYIIVFSSIGDESIPTQDKVQVALRVSLITVLSIGIIIFGTFCGNNKKIKDNLSLDEEEEKGE